MFLIKGNNARIMPKFGANRKSNEKTPREVKIPGTFEN